jgi:hypothetical protein
MKSIEMIVNANPSVALVGRHFFYPIAINDQEPALFVFYFSQNVRRSSDALCVSSDLCMRFQPLANFCQLDRSTVLTIVVCFPPRVRLQCYRSLMGIFYFF